MMYTIGYESRCFDEFINCLKNNDIKLLVDIREIPISRKKGFSKSILSKQLREFKIDYIHMKSLGSPKDLRNKLKHDGDFCFFKKEYSKYLRSQRDEVKELYQLALNKETCIMCFEKNPENCHRNLVAKEIIKINGNGLTVKHIV